MEQIKDYICNVDGIMSMAVHGYAKDIAELMSEDYGTEVTEVEVLRAIADLYQTDLLFMDFASRLLNQRNEIRQGRVDQPDWN